MKRGDAEAQRINELTEKVIGAAIEVHKSLGSGLPESAYEECLCHELTLPGILLRLFCPYMPANSSLTSDSSISGSGSSSISVLPDSLMESNGS